MPHCSPETLAVAALREPLPPADEEHLDGCARCRDEVASLRRGVDALAVPELAAPGHAVAPPARVWDAVAAATGVSVAPRPERIAAASAGVPAPFPLPASAPPPPEEDVATTAPAPVRRLRPRRRRLLLAVAAAAVVGGAVGAGVTALSRDPDTGTAVARATLDPLNGVAARGDAAVVRRGDAQVLQVDVADVPPLDGSYYEVWLIAPDLTDMVPVGVLHDGHAALDLPDGLDVSRYPLVDVSVEPLDGNPAHSGDSVVRGGLGV